MKEILNAFVLDLAKDLAKEEFKMLWGVPGEIEKLQNNINLISEVVADAERRRINERAIDYWLKQLKDVMYDADDILDRCRIEAEECKEGSSSTSSVCFPFSLLSCFPLPLISCLPLPLLNCLQNPIFAHDIGKEIRKLNLKLGEISRGRSEFSLQITSSPDMQQVAYQISRNTSPVGEIDIVGSRIEEDTRSLVDLLIKDDRRRNILVFAIVGAGGIGKTTLAKRIYDDRRVQEEFSVKRWVCVSQEFDEIKLLKSILDGDKNDLAEDQSKTSSLEPEVQNILKLLKDIDDSAKDDLAGNQSKSSLEPKVESSLRGKKLFLVLDDVWTAMVWRDLLCNTLKSCAAGSRILVTTRNEQIAKQMLAVDVHHVDKLSLEDGWSLLCKKVVLTGEEGEIQHLKDIGMEIVKKCDGLPLAIKAVSGVLCTKERTEGAWNGVLESTTWSISGLPEEVNRALYLSYEDLPSHLKQCFIYCSLFPGDHVIWLPTITKLWIAEGFVRAEGSSTVEETAEEYGRELIMRNLLQRSHARTCQMHDLLYCLARHLAGDESSVVWKVQDVGSSNRSMKLRRACLMDRDIADNELTEILDVFVKQDSLRTLMWEGRLMCETRMDDVFSKLSLLRVLDISCSDSDNIQRLPDSLGNLKHLRYLNIADTRISELPESIGNLRNLQFLNMRRCSHISHLPDSIVNLRNLRSLDVCGTGVVGMPAGLGMLKNLRVLHGFMLQSNRTEGWCTIEELRSLLHLRVLSIDALQCISSISEARAAQLGNKSKLIVLHLRCTPDLQPSQEEMRRIEEVFEELHPPPHLEELYICGYFGREFPKWMANTFSSTSIPFPHLRYLGLQGCNYWERVPPCGLLPDLECLKISDAASVIDVGPEFLEGTNSSSRVRGKAVVDASKYGFPKLKELYFQSMPNWRAWHWDKGTQAMACLKFLTIYNCPKLISLPEGLLLHATSLTALLIQSASSLTTIENLLSLKELYMIYNPELEKVSNLPALTTLCVENCPKLQVVENLQSLERLNLFDNEMKSLPSYLLEGVHTAHLEKLNIWCGMELIRNICRRDNPEWQTIQGIQQVHVYSVDRSVHAFYNKSPFSFTTNFNDTTTSSSSEMPSSI